MSGNIIQLNEQFIHNELKPIVKNSVEETLNALLDAEADKLVQAEHYEREQTRKGYRAGHYERAFSTQAGDITLKVPKLKGLTFESAIIQHYQRRECSVEEALVEIILPAFLCVVLKVLQRFSGDRRFQPEPLAI